MTSFSMINDLKGSILRVGDRHLDLDYPYQFRGCTASPDGIVTCAGGIFEMAGSGCYQILSYKDDEWYLGKTRVNLDEVNFYLISKDGKLYCSLLTQEVLLKEVFGKVKEIGKDVGFIESDHTEYIAHIKTYPPDALDVHINRDWHRRQNDKD